MLRSEFSLNLRKCYAIQTYDGTGEYFNEDTRLLYDDNSTSYHYSQTKIIIIDTELMENPDIETYRSVRQGVRELKAVSPYNYKENNPPGEQQKK